jgi:hypothetical protein
MDKNELKVTALLERVSEITTQYENRVADLRVDITVLSQELGEAQAEVKRLSDELVQTRDNGVVTSDTE